MAKSVQPSEAACDLCGETASVVVLSLPSRDLRRCLGCGLVRLHPVPSALELDAVYDSDDYYTAVPPTLRQGLAFRLQDRVLRTFWGYPECPGPVERRFWACLLWPLKHRFLPVPYPGDAPVLDIGCGNGQRLLELRHYGCGRLYGVEPTRAAAEQAIRATRADIRACLLEEAELPSGYFGLVILNQVLEHVPSPRRTLAAIRELLRPGGALYLTVPNFGGAEAKFFGAHWSGLQLPAHLHHFTAEPLRRLLRDSGFEIRLWRTDSVFSVTAASLHDFRCARTRGWKSWLSRLPRPWWQTATLAADALGQGQMIRLVAVRRD